MYLHYYRIILLIDLKDTDLAIKVVLSTVLLLFKFRLFMI